MNIFKTTAVAVISSLVIGTAPAWSGTVDSRPVLDHAGNLIQELCPLRRCGSELARTIRG